MSELLPSENGGYGESNIEPYAADFTEWEQELAAEPHIAELRAQLGSLSLVETIDYDTRDLLNEDEVEELEEPEGPGGTKKPKENETKKEEQLQYDPLNLQPEKASGEQGPHVTQDELFSAAMGLIYFTTGISVEEVFEESS